MATTTKQSRVAFSASRRAVRDRLIGEAAAAFRSECERARSARDAAIARAKAVCAMEIKRGPVASPDPRQITID